jgi:hypothetical protein
MRFVVWLPLVACTAAPASRTTTASVELRRTGGFGPSPGPASTCAPIEEHYTIDLATHALAWQICMDPTQTGAFTLQPGSAMLDAATFAQFDDALDALEMLGPPTIECHSDTENTVTLVHADHTRVTLDATACDEQDLFMLAISGIPAM